MDRTFKHRVASFWEWYPTVGQRFFETIEAGNCQDLTDEVVDFMAETMPGLAWVFGPGENGGHSFTISGEGQAAKQLLAQYWLSHAVELEGWTFYGSRQATPGFENFEIQIGDLGRVDAEHFLVRTTVDEEEQTLDIETWHPTFHELPEEHHQQLLFLFLDEALGEFGVENWIGHIDIAPIEESAIDGRNVHRLSNLPKFIADVQRYHGWEKLSPLESFTAYQIKEQSDTLRGDTIAGITCIPNVLFDLLESGGQLEEDPLEETGASLKFLRIDRRAFADGQEANARQNIEDVLQEKLAEHDSGRTLGGGTGIAAAYIDVLVLDGSSTKNIVDEAMQSLELSGRYEWHDFA